MLAAGRRVATVGPWASCSLHLWPGLTQPSILSGSVNEYWLRLGRYKAGRLCATLLGARHVPERLCGGSVYLGRYNKTKQVLDLYLLPFYSFSQ